MRPIVVGVAHLFNVALTYRTSRMVGGGQVDQPAGGLASWAVLYIRELDTVSKCCKVRRFELLGTGRGDCGT